jgi:hypothetical protein
MKYLLFIFLLVSCIKTITTSTCPEVPYLSKDYQKHLLKIMEKENDIILNEIISQYYTLRQQLRICNKQNY